MSLSSSSQSDEEIEEDEVFIQSADSWKKPRRWWQWAVVGVILSVLVIGACLWLFFPASLTTNVEPSLRRYEDISTFVWLGNGCFWERQYSYVQLELQKPGQYLASLSLNDLRPFPESERKCHSASGICRLY
jgi:hypothetical protein